MPNHAPATAPPPASGGARGRSPSIWPGAAGHGDAAAGKPRGAEAIRLALAGAAEAA